MLRNLLLLTTLCAFLLLPACSQTEDSNAAVDTTQKQNNKVTRTKDTQQASDNSYTIVYKKINGETIKLIERKSSYQKLTIKDLQESVEKKDPDATYELARRYLKGEGVIQDISKALSLLDSAVDLGSTEALNDMASFYQVGNFGYKKNMNKAFGLFKQAAERGDSLAQYNTATCYFNGYGTDIDYKESLYWSNTAAEQKDPGALQLLGKHYLQGAGVSQNTKKAISLFEEAIALGDSTAYAELGHLYAEGKLVKQNLDKAISLFNKGVAAGEPNSIGQLGYLYSKGKGVPKNIAKGLEYTRKAAQMGIPFAQNNLGSAYYSGRGIKQSDSSAFHWIQLAAEQGYPIAMGTLGGFYLIPVGTKQDLNKAYEYSIKAAKKCDAGGIFTLGQMYEYGEVVKQSAQKAFAHYFIAKELETQDQNFTAAVNSYLTPLKAKMSASEIQAAEREIPKLKKEYGLQ